MDILGQLMEGCMDSVVAWCDNVKCSNPITTSDVKHGAIIDDEYAICSRCSKNKTLVLKIRDRYLPEAYDDTDECVEE